MIGSLDFTHERDLTIDELIRRVEVYHPDASMDELRKAYLFAEKAHQGQKRSSGEDYIIHPLNVAATLVKLRMDMDSLKAGLLHDVLEDCDVTEEEIISEFSPAVAAIVVGLTKISKIQFKTKEENQAENFRKMVVAMARDLRVIIVKLADRMHNMRTLQYVSVEKQKKVAQETIDIYVPLASRLGIHSVKAELEDLCLRYIQPDTYYQLAEEVAMKKKDRELYIREVVGIIQEKLTEYSIEGDVRGRSKHFYSIFRKMQQRGVSFDQVQDILAFRILVGNITECYKCLGVIHSSFTPIPGRFKDYIAIPKVNNYQSLHTTVIGPKAERIEIQIRTYEMNEVAEKGVAAHWKYKEGGDDKGKQRLKLEWVDELLEYNQSVKGHTEFLDIVKNDLDVSGVFIFTPHGDVMELKYGSTPLDFAYAIHTEVGNQCVGAKANGKIVPLKYRLKSGDVVEIITSKTQTPSKDWIKLVKTSKAKSKIKQWILKIEKDKDRDTGLELFEKQLKVHGQSLKQWKKNDEIEKVCREWKCKTEEELYIQIGSGKISLKEVMRKIFPALHEPSKVLPNTGSHGQVINDIDQQAKKISRNDNAVIVDGLEDVVVRMGKCCNPIPGDSIVGFITRGRGITVHTHNCHKKNQSDFERTIDVVWNSEYSFTHPVNIRVLTQDKPGILSLISKSINNLDLNIRSAQARSLPDHKGSFIFEIEVKDYSELIKAMSAIEAIEDVIQVERV